MAAVPLALVATVVEVEGSSATPAIGCGRNNGTWTSSQSLRKTFINSIPTLPGGIRYVVSMVLEMLCNSCRKCAPSCTCCSYAIVYDRWTCFALCILILQQEVEQYRRAKTITFKGRECPNPIAKFHEASFPCKCQCNVKSVGKSLRK